VPRNNLAFAVDFPSFMEAAPLLHRLCGSIGTAKIGVELFTRDGPTAVTAASALGLDVFLDLKLHDIPETVDRAVANACALGVRFLTLHTSGGRTMLERAASRCAKENTGLTLLGVTVLTSLDRGDLEALGIDLEPAALVVRLARLAFDAGIRGVVCSANEVARVRRALGPDVFLVTPGIRPSGTSAGDQKRVATPASAISYGANLLVVGRPIRDAADPVAAANAIVAEIDMALALKSTT
jgi:orotidine-5'-phosphate decarboxylase